MTKLFQPLTVGDVKLGHRVAMAPLTRYRMGDDYKATPMNKGTLNIFTIRNQVDQVSQSTMSNEHVYQAPLLSARQPSSPGTPSAPKMLQESGKKTTSLPGKTSRQQYMLKDVRYTANSGIKAVPQGPMRWTQKASRWSHPARYPSHLKTEHQWK